MVRAIHPWNAGILMVRFNIYRFIQLNLQVKMQHVIIFTGSVKTLRITDRVSIPESSTPIL